MLRNHDYGKDDCVEEVEGNVRRQVEDCCVEDVIVLKIIVGECVLVWVNVTVMQNTGRNAENRRA